MNIEITHKYKNSMKYRLTEEAIEVGDATLYGLECAESFGDVNAGEKGGCV